MKFLKRQGSAEDQKGEWTAYMDYVASRKGLLPAEVYEYILAPWHYDPRDHRCPHDAWVEEMSGYS